MPVSFGILRRRFVPIVLGLLCVALLIGWAAGRTSGAPRGASSSAPTVSQRASGADVGMSTIAYADLPSGARRTLGLIGAGGPYPYRQDDTVYQNRNKALPTQPRGYYREYTVRTPGESDRGPRRIVVGRGGTAYYTADHYDTFRRVLR